MPKPLPIHCRENAGSGFLVTDGLKAWLVTCVHLVSGLRKTPPIASIFTTAEIRVAGTPVVIPLFFDGQKRFSLVKNETDGFLVDSIAIRLMPHEIAALTSFGMYEARSVKPAVVGDVVIATGFPGLGKRMTSGAAVFEPTDEQYHVEEVTGISIRLSKPGVSGLSGGPVVNDVGLIGIMHGDVGISTEMSSALVISLDVIAVQLFR